MNELGHETHERREAALIKLAIDPSPRRLRQTLAAVDRRLAGLEAPTMRRIRLILSEVIGRSSQAAGTRRGLIAMQIDVMSESIRIELFGPGLSLPEPDREPSAAGPPPFPGWVLGDLVDDWGIERRRGEAGIWLLVAR